MNENCFTKLWKIQMTDWQRALVVAILATPAGILYDWATVANYTFSWVALIKGGVAGGVGYVLKNFITGENGKLFTNK